MTSEPEKAIFAAGCFWGVQYLFDQQEGVISTSVGYIGGSRPNPTYEHVCSGATGHVEAVEVIFNPEVVSYETLVRLFFEIHDFEQINGQGPDIGDQYLSVIFYTDEHQRDVAEMVIDELDDMGYEVATSLDEAAPFWPAEEYHQDYYVKKGGLPYCHARRKVF